MQKKKVVLSEGKKFLYINPLPANVENIVSSE